MNNTYGIVKPSVIDPETDIEIFYHYRPDRASTDESFRYFVKVDSPSSMLTASTIEEDDAEVTTDLRLPGMYTLSLPASIFSKVGFYTIYIRPREIHCEIKDIGALTAYPDVMGIVIDTATLDADVQSMFANEKLAGYRVEYYGNNGNGLEREKYYRIITGNYYCEVVSQNISSSSQNSNGYRFNDSATLTFLTVTPATAPSYKSSSKPYIGAPAQHICISNSLFNPVCVEVEICENDAETLATLVAGDQIRSLDEGMVTTYNGDGEIFRQQDFFTAKENGKAVYEGRFNRTDNIDDSVPYDELREL
ncbi:MAG: hypothetical protein LUD72_06160 [Bacteroidales bacterium]|nr:hypothetical protein [Bacteroidales bacterium]